jgi:hypothetical protein
VKRYFKRRLFICNPLLYKNIKGFINGNLFRAAIAVFEAAEGSQGGKNHGTEKGLDIKETKGDFQD